MLERITRQVLINGTRCCLAGRDGVDQQPCSVSEITGDKDALCSGLQRDWVNLEPVASHSLNVLSAVLQK